MSGNPLGQGDLLSNKLTIQTCLKGHHATGQPQRNLLSLGYEYLQKATFLVFLQFKSEM